MDGADELYPLRSSFWLGDYKGALEAAKGLKPSSEALKIQLKVYLYRTYIEMGMEEKVLSEVDFDSSPTSLQAVRLFAQAVSSPEKKDEVLMKLNELINDDNSASNESLKLMAGYINATFGDVQNAIRMASNTSSIELNALRTELLLKIRRPDLAKECLRSLSDVDEDAILTQMASAQVNMALGGEFYQEAVYVLEEMLTRCEGKSTKLCSLLCAANMKLGAYDAALRAAQKGLRNEGVQITKEGIKWGGIDANRAGNLDLLGNLWSLCKILKKKGFATECEKKTR